MDQYSLTICLTVLRFDVPFAIQLMLFSGNLTPSWGRPKPASSEDIYVACIMLFILWLCRESHNTVCSTAHICDRQKTVWQNVFIQTMYKIKKQKLFCTCLAWTLLIWNGCPMPYSIPSVQLIKHANEMPSFALTFKRVSCSSTLTKLKHEVIRNSSLILYIFNVFSIT